MGQNVFLVILGQSGGAFCAIYPLESQQEFFWKKPYAANLPIEIQLMSKLQKKMDGYPAIERTNGRH